MASESDPIVISGLAGRFPESENIDEFWTKLINGVDLVTDDDRRYPKGKIIRIFEKLEQT